MKTFTIENETNNITLHTTIQEAEAVANAETLPQRSRAGEAGGELARCPAGRHLE